MEWGRPAPRRVIVMVSMLCSKASARAASAYAVSPGVADHDDRVVRTDHGGRGRRTAWPAPRGCLPGLGEEGGAEFSRMQAGARAYQPDAMGPVEPFGSDVHLRPGLVGRQQLAERIRL